MTKAYFNWSGGKDSALALWKVLKEKSFRLNIYSQASTVFMIEFPCMV
jgi:diphthamide synthase (EF-2-diphthine--ammonia ligase)